MIKLDTDQLRSVIIAILVAPHLKFRVGSIESSIYESAMAADLRLKYNTKIIEDAERLARSME